MIGAKNVERPTGFVISRNFLVPPHSGHLEILVREQILKIRKSGPPSAEIGKIRYGNSRQTAFGQPNPGTVGAIVVSRDTKMAGES